MVDFKKLREARALPRSDDPVEIFRRLPKPPGINDLYSSQAQVLMDWHEHRQQRDTVIKLHTGGGKTLVGLLVAQATLNELREPVLYLCATTQLVEQTLAKATEYSIRAVGYSSGQPLPEAFVGADAVLVATYQALFNGRSLFGVRGGGRDIVHAGGIILDDAHVSFATVRSQFTLTVSKQRAPEHYAELTSAFRADFQEVGRLGTFDDVVAGSEYTVLEVPYWAWKNRQGAIHGTLRAAVDDGLEWPLVRDSLEYCHAFVSRDAFVVSPLFPFVDLIPTFSDCPRRVFMSATIADDSALIETFDADEELVAEPITSNSLAGVAERMILAPELMPEPIKDLGQVLRRLATWSAEKRGAGTVILTPSNAAAAGWDPVATVPGSADEVAALVKELQKEETRGPVVFANRYDGIDLPNGACRLLIVDGLPRGTSAYDQYRANVFLGGTAVNTLLAQRIEQGIGRAARGAGDYCVVVLTGRDLVAWLGRESNLKLLTNSTRAQIEIGAEVSRSIDGLQELARTIQRSFARDQDWIEYHAEQLAELSDAQLPKGAELARAAVCRKALRLLRDGYHEKSLNALTTFEDARSTLGGEALDPQTRGWLLEFAARIALLWGRDDLALDLQRQAYSKNRNLSRPRAAIPYVPLVPPGPQARSIVANLGPFRARRGFVAEFDEAVSQLVPSASANQFEEALRGLGNTLGFRAERPEKTYGVGPDVLWLLDERRALVIEAKSRKNGTSALTKEQHGQLLNAEQWFNREYPEMVCMRVSVHPNVRVTRSTVPGSSRALTLAALASLVADARQLLDELCSLAASDDELAARCEGLLQKSQLTPERLIDQYLEPFEPGI